MSLTPAAEANKQHWDETLTKLLDLSTSTVKRNSELESRVAELDLELSVWKQAHATVVESAERDRKAHNAQVTTLNRQISSLETIKRTPPRQNQNPLIICAIDAEVNVFHPSLLRQGYQGGRQAAQYTTKGIAEYLSQEGVQVFGRLSFWITIYLNRRSILETLLNNSVCTADQFEGFISGFSQTSPRFQVVEVEPGKDAVALKIQQQLETFTRFPQTLRVFFTGGTGDTLLPTAHSLANEELLGKLVLFHGSDEPASELRQLAIPTMHIDDLFMVGRPVPALRMLPPARSPISPLGSAHSQSTAGGLTSPGSEISQAAMSCPGPMVTPGKPIDPTKVPPPCNEHYLMSCSKGPGCKYSHDWALTAEQLDILAKNAKKAPCNYLKNGLECPHGSRCCWGHVCPGGSNCFHLSKGKCWFKGEGMHPLADPGEER
ncbi:uncharacterized protein PHACADRAFT_157775 [Phanerochaete carnosa HHB-10118-sp]|uniref:C3H1-type domain-containing protein n=1 Tax=Phanerochaete carnosa (strain HHB-10118-sp) TaxID=650164 RepID=K5W670_PHACS|nr:uncharacterized protein PHACADRAFT_157775 [Phanerochaete carnosa HHB-10118-sp]EKM59408.1 hypothetical protein PHACADRAFT_157775 [Phanerochaete carnosa HHB-10118-sp]